MGSWNWKKKKKRRDQEKAEEARVVNHFEKDTFGSTWPNFKTLMSTVWNSKGIDTGQLERGAEGADPHQPASWWLSAFKKLTDHFKNSSGLQKNWTGSTVPDPLGHSPSHHLASVWCICYNSWTNQSPCPHLSGLQFSRNWSISFKAYVYRDVHTIILVAYWLFNVCRFVVISPLFIIAVICVLLGRV